MIAATVEQAGLAKHLEAIDFRHASPVGLALVHQPAYVDLVRLACEEGFTFIGSQDTSMSACTSDQSRSVFRVRATRTKRESAMGWGSR